MRLIASVAVSVVLARSSLAFANGPSDVPDQFMKQLSPAKLASDDSQRQP